jgi:MYXO-CTERM domain-containing protein
MNRKHAFSLAALGLSGLAAHAFPIAVPGSEGSLVIVAGTDPVVATYEGNSASYSNDLYLERDGAGNPGMDGITANDLFIFNNQSTPVGSTLNLGSFVPGTELAFRLHVNNTGYDYFSGPASRNPDGLPHARVQDNWLPSVTLVSFEDLYGTPEGINGFNDLSFSFSNTRGTSQVPEPMTTGLWLGLTGLGMAWVARRRRA